MGVAGVCTYHHGRQPHTPHPHHRNRILPTRARHVHHRPAARLQAAPQRRQQLEVVPAQAQPRHADDALVADDGVAREAGLAEEAAADIRCGTRRRGKEDGLPDEVDVEEGLAVRGRAGGADVAGSAVREGEEDGVAGGEMRDGAAGADDVAGAWWDRV